MVYRLLLGAVLVLGFIGVPTPAQAYNRDAAATYANTWWNGSNGAYPWRFGNDCTNFASQAMHQGGINFRAPSSGWQGGADFGNDKWYGDNSHWTHTWSVTSKLFAFTANHLTAGNYQYRAAATSQPANIPAPHARGDLVFYEWGNADGSTPDHVNVGVWSGTDPNSPSYSGDRVTGHTSDRKNAIWHLKPYNSRFNVTSYYIQHIPDSKV